MVFMGYCAFPGIFEIAGYSEVSGLVNIFLIGCYGVSVPEIGSARIPYCPIRS